MTTRHLQAVAARLGLRPELAGELLERLPDRLQRELDERRRGSRLVRGAERSVVASLLGANDGFDREKLEDRMDAQQDDVLPEPSHAPVPVREGVDELELVMKHRGLDERMGLTIGVEKRQQIAHEPWNLPGRRGEMGDTSAAQDADALPAIAPCILREPLHHQAVRGEEVTFGGRIEGRGPVVCRDGVLDLEDLTSRTRHASMLEDGGDLILGEGVALDGEAALDAADAISPTELWLRPRAHQPFVSTDEAEDLSAMRQDLGGDREWRASAPGR